jgi:hypothetical protein
MFKTTVFVKYVTHIWMHVLDFYLILVLTNEYFPGTSGVLKQLSEKGLSVSSPSWNDNRSLITNAVAISANSGQIGAVLDTSCNLAVQFLIWVN